MSGPEFPGSRFSDNGLSAERFDPYGAPQFQTRRSSRGCWIWAVLLGAGCLVLVCGGGIALLVGFGMHVITTEIEDLLADNPILKEHVGDVQSFEMEWTRSFADEDDDTYVYRVRGTKGEGRITVKHITGDDGNEQILSAELRLSNGETYDLMPGQP